MLIQLSPDIKSHDKPKKESLYKLSIDEVKKEEPLKKEEVKEIVNKVFGIKE